VERWEYGSGEERTAIKRSSLSRGDDQKGRQFFFNKNRATPSVTDPGDTNPSDATVHSYLSSISFKCFLALITISSCRSTSSSGLTTITYFILLTLIYKVHTFLLTKKLQDISNRFSRTPSYPAMFKYTDN